MPSGRRPEATYSEPTPREAFSAVALAESRVDRLWGTDKLAPDQRLALKGFAGTYAEFFAREIQISESARRGNSADIGVLIPGLVKIDQVLDQQEAIEAMGVSKRFIEGARLAAMSGVLRDLIR